MRHFILNIFILVILAACSSPAPKMTPAERQSEYLKQQNQLHTLRSWEMHGRMNIYHRGRSDTVNVTWLQEPTAYGLKLAGSLGHGAVYILSDGNGVTFKDSDGTVDTAPTPEALLQQYTGYNLPVSNMHYWVLGRPVPSGSPEIKLNPQGFMIELEQDMWHITYQNYRQYGKYYLPSKIIMHHPEEFRITISVHEWDIPGI